jgi:hypothetical protein
MKLIKILLVFLLFSFIIANAGWPIPKGCPLEGYEKMNIVLVIMLFEKYKII